MKYLIAHVFGGEEADFCCQISADVAARFSISDSHKHIPPHLTLKAPFEATNRQIREVKNIIKAITTNSEPAGITLKGFNNFNHGVIYLKASIESAGQITVQALTSQLKQLSWLSLSPHDDDTTFHVTLARPNSHQQFQAIFKYIQNTYNPDFVTRFDNISLLKKKKENWGIAKQYSLV